MQVIDLLKLFSPILPVYALRFTNEARNDLGIRPPLQLMTSEPNARHKKAVALCRLKWRQVKRLQLGRTFTETPCHLNDPIGIHSDVRC
jgi:hypothetical protein